MRLRLRMRAIERAHENGQDVHHHGAAADVGVRDQGCRHGAFILIVLVYRYTALAVSAAVRPSTNVPVRSR